LVTNELTATSPAAHQIAEPRPRRRWVLDVVLLVGLVGLVPVVHDVGSMLSQPYWLDESWVALSVRSSWSDLPFVTAPTPLGWSVLLRLIPDSADLRLLTLFFHGVGVAAAYAFGRMLRWPTTAQSRLVALAGAAAVLLLPAQQLRNDLKQYTADAAVTLALLALSAWTESRWSRRRLAVTVAAVPLGLLVSHVTAIAAVAVFAGLVLATVIARQRRRCVEALVASGAAAVILAVVDLTISGRNRNEQLVNYWIAYFPSVGGLPAYLGDHIAQLLPLFGLPTPLAMVVLPLLVTLGLITLGRHGAPAALIAVLAMPVICLVLGVAHIYPLLDSRTSHFLLVTIAAVAGIGVAGTALGLTALVRRWWPALRTWRTPVAAALTIVAIAGFAWSNAHWYRFTGRAPGVPSVAPMVTEDVRSATEYVRGHRAPQDVVLLSAQARYGVTFYWDDEPLRPLAYPNSVGWTPALPAGVPFVVAANTTAPAIADAVEQAEALAAHNGPGARIWLIRTHWTGEVAGWSAALAGKRTQTMTGGVEPVLLITPLWSIAQ
jgi:hypothetical protein